MWLRGFLTGINNSVDHFATSIQHAETTGRVQKPTYTRNREDRKHGPHAIKWDTRSALTYINLPTGI
jgi:hypothetical protein